MIEAPETWRYAFATLEYFHIYHLPFDPTGMTGDEVLKKARELNLEPDRSLSADRPKGLWREMR